MDAIRQSHDNTHGVGVNVYSLQGDDQLQLLTDEVTFLCEGFWENIQWGFILELAWLLSLERNRRILPGTLLHQRQQHEPSLLTNTPEDALLPLSFETTPG